MATLLVAILYFFAPTSLHPIDSKSILYIFFIVLTFTYIFPVISVLVLKHAGVVKSVHLQDKEERLVPFLFTAGFYALNTYMFAGKLELYNALTVMLGATTITVFLVALISILVKISVHATATGGLIGLLLALKFTYLDSTLFWPVIFAFIIHGIVSSSRLYLHTHTPKEVHGGALLGFITNFGIAYFYL